MNSSNVYGCRSAAGRDAAGGSGGRTGNDNTFASSTIPPSIICWMRPSNLVESCSKTAFANFALLLHKM